MPVSHLNNMNTQQSPVAVVGLGLIGTSLAKRLLDAGFVVHGYDVDAARLANFEKLGGRPAATLRDVARAARTIVLSVFNTDQVEAVVEGRAGAAHLELDASHAVVCTSTCDPDRVAVLAATCMPHPSAMGGPFHMSSTCLTTRPLERCFCFLGTDGCLQPAPHQATTARCNRAR